MEKEGTQQGASEKLDVKNYVPLICFTSLLSRFLESHKASEKHSIHNNRKQTPLSWWLHVQSKEHTGNICMFVDYSNGYLLAFFPMSVVFILLHCSNVWETEDATRPHCTGKIVFRIFDPGDIDLLCSSLLWEEMMESYRWSKSNVGADYLISLSNWPESCSFLTQLRYLNLISVYKSIWGFVFILVSWECWRKCESIIHNSPTWLMIEIKQPHQRNNVTCPLVYIPHIKEEVHPWWKRVVEE